MILLKCHDIFYKVILFSVYDIFYFHNFIDTL
uniref:Uncharacterized protein n=1 Tax=Myoviridae sp. ctcyQ27 TaxID=2825139 RepID=A0A8S5UFN5_9CAUD|nr:MAG TPA: hypothetical protein [Myoviridae sp. ctcyQ27]